MSWTPVAAPPRRSPPLPGSPRDRRRVPSTPPSVPTPPATRELAPAVFTATLVLADAVALAAALFATYWLRFLSGALPVPLGIPDLGFYAGSLAVVIPVGLFVANAAGLYRPYRTAGFLRDAMRVARAMVLLGVLLASIAFFYRDFSYSRTFLVGYLAVSWVITVGLRGLAALAHRGLRARGFGVQRVGIVGGGRLGDRLAENIRARPGSGLSVVARLDGERWSALEGGEASRVGRTTRVCAFAAEHRIERILVTDPELTHDERLDLVEACHDAGIRCEFVPDLFEVMLGRVRVEELDGIPLVGSRLHPLDRVDRVKKRTLDLLVSGLGLTVFLPLFAAITLLVKLDSRGPVFFAQRRIGRDGREFRILKFRSMPPDAERSTGPVRAQRDDARPTRVGRWLRRSSLDELPQLWNVLKGEMSLVGPRPERGHFVEEFRHSIPRYLERHGVKSGLTGWAQVNGLRGDTSIEERTRYDIWYVENWSLALDVKILVLTLFRFLFQEEAY